MNEGWTLVKALHIGETTLGLGMTHDRAVIRSEGSKSCMIRKQPRWTIFYGILFIDFSNLFRASWDVNQALTHVHRPTDQETR